jgi:hypothetical protein
VRWVDTAQDTTPDHGSGRTGAYVPGPLVTVASVLRAGTEVRLVRLDAPENPDGARELPTAWSLRLGGWPVPAASRPAPARLPDGPGVHSEAAGLRTRSRVHGLRGFSRAGVTSERGTGPLAAWTVTPWLATEGPVPLGEVLAATVRLDRGGDEVPEPTVFVRAIGDGSHQVTVTWADGAREDVTMPAPA